MFTLLAEHRTTLNQLAGLIQEEQDYVAEIYSDADDITATLKYALQKVDEKFVVLFIGGFACGKTSMINALIGENLLPTVFLPETAIVYELHYGNQKRVTVYPKDDNPFDLREVTTDEILKYVSLCTEDVRITAKFEKMVIYWPLEILKDGVVLVDTPGINDPYSNDYIVNDYLPKADAIVYVMNLTHAYLRFDKDFLETINALGHKEIITAYTFYDTVENYCRGNFQKLRNLRKMLINYMLNHTELGEESVHFLDSIGGLDAKLEGDSEAWSKSGFKGFEDYLDRYLVESKGTAQVKEIIRVIVDRANKMISKEAEKRLQVARNYLLKVSKNYRKGLEERLPEIEQMVRKFITVELPQRIDLEDFQPETSLPMGLDQFNPDAKRNALQAIKNECECEILRRINLECKKWGIDTLSDYLKTLAKKSSAGKDFPVEPFVADKFLNTFPRYMFALNNLDTVQIKVRVAKYAKEFLQINSDKMINDIMSDVKDYVEKTCAGAEKILRDEVENTERLVRQMLEDEESDLAETIKAANAAVNKLKAIKDKALQIGRDYGISF